MKSQRQHEQQAEAESVIAQLLRAQRECALAAQEKGVSPWLGFVHLHWAGFSLLKGAFRDALANSTSATKRPLVEGTQRPPRPCLLRHGEFQIHPHNRVRDLVDLLLTEVWANVTTELGIVCPFQRQLGDKPPRRIFPFFYLFIYLFTFWYTDALC